MKTLLAIWVAAMGVLAYGFWNYNSVAGDYARQVDEQSIQIYRLADDARTTYFAAFVTVFVIGIMAIGVNTWYQSYRETHPRQHIKDNYEEAYKSRLVYLAPVSLSFFLTGTMAGILGESYSTVAPLLILGVILGAVARVNYARYSELLDFKADDNHHRRSYP